MPWENLFPFLTAHLRLIRSPIWIKVYILWNLPIRTDNWKPRVFRNN